MSPRPSRRQKEGERQHAGGGDGGRQGDGGGIEVAAEKDLPDYEARTSTRLPREGAKPVHLLPLWVSQNRGNRRGCSRSNVGELVHVEHFAIVQAAFNLSSDVLIIAVPIPMIVSLSLPLKQKVFLGILFSMGTFVVSSLLFPGLQPSFY